MRDLFEQAAGPDQTTAMSIGGALAAPMTAHQYDFKMLPLGQMLSMEWFETLKPFPPMQAPASFNLSQVEEQSKGTDQASDWCNGFNEGRVKRTLIFLQRRPTLTAAVGEGVDELRASRAKAEDQARIVGDDLALSLPGLLLRACCL